MHWNDIEKIVERLEEIYSDEEIPEDDLSYLHEMILSIPEFEDREEEVDEDQLNLILEAWLETRHG